MKTLLRHSDLLFAVLWAALCYLDIERGDALWSAVTGFMCGVDLIFYFHKMVGNENSNS